MHRLHAALLAGLALPACMRSDVEPMADAASGETTDPGSEASGVPVESVTGNETSPPTETTTVGTSTGGQDGDADDDATDDEAGDACDGDPACGPGETPENCPDQCTVCGDGVVSGDEACDNGSNQSPAYVDDEPEDGACAPDCRAVGWCGDGVINGPEPCDGGGHQTAGCEYGCRIPTCGDGVLNPDQETCDDGNTKAGDGCAADCDHLERRVFLSSIAVGADFNPDDFNPGNFAGLELADYRCMLLASEADKFGYFKAWLSTSATSPAERFDTSFTGHYILMTAGSPIVAEGWPDLVDGDLLHPINYNEKGKPVAPDLVWTNTGLSGGRASDQTCGDWTSTALIDSTMIGGSDQIDATWTVATDQSCAGTLRFYCFEDPA